MASYATRHLVHNHQLNGFLGMLRIDWESCLRARILFLVLLVFIFMFRYAPSTRARAGWPLLLACAESDEVSASQPIARG
jgi:hypothetical protein